MMDLVHQFSDSTRFPTRKGKFDNGLATLPEVDGKELGDCCLSDAIGTFEHN